MSGVRPGQKPRLLLFFFHIKAHITAQNEKQVPSGAIRQGLQYLPLPKISVSLIIITEHVSKSPRIMRMGGSKITGTFKGCSNLFSSVCLIFLSFPHEKVHRCLSKCPEPPLNPPYICSSSPVHLGDYSHKF